MPDYHPEIVKDLIKLKANLKVTGKYLPDHLKDFVKLSKLNGTKITIKAEGLHPDHLKALAKINNVGLTLDI